MKILRAEHLGMCFGVRDAIELALDHARQGSLTILGQLVHNETVLASLRERGIRIEENPATLPPGPVMITAHGASERRMSEVRGRGFPLIEATCPLVRLAHRAVVRLVQEGYHPVVVGRRDHVEVRGLTEDLDRFDVVQTEADVEALEAHPRFGVAAQTTQPIERVRHLVGLIRGRFPDSEVRFVDTVCRPTKQRQHAAIELAQECDVLVVIGGAASNNTRELSATCRQYCPRVHQVQGPDELRPEWLAEAHTVGLTAGTSTPDAVIDAVERRLQELVPAEVGHV